MMKPEPLALWREQELFTDHGNSNPGFLGCARGVFVPDGVSVNNTMNLNAEAQDEYDTLLRLLQSSAAGYLLKDTAAMSAYCQDRLQSHIPYPFNRECWGFRVLTDRMAWYIACTPWNEKKQFELYAYDRTVLMTALAKDAGLPESCSGVFRYTGERIIIRYGDRRFEGFPQYGSNVDTNSAFADEANRAAKISKAQRAAMEQGVIFGWDTPVADPANYDKDGYYVPVPSSKKKK